MLLLSKPCACGSYLAKAVGGFGLSASTSGSMLTGKCEGCKKSADVREVLVDTLKSDQEPHVIPNYLCGEPLTLVVKKCAYGPRGEFPKADVKCAGAVYQVGTRMAICLGHRMASEVGHVAFLNNRLKAEQERLAQTQARLAIITELLVKEVA